jgi:hypothetical protein
MAWPKNVAAKVVSGYIGLKYNVSPSLLRIQDPPMGALPFFNNSATPQTRKAELALALGGLLKHLEELDVPLEKRRTANAALNALVAAAEVEASPSSQLVTVALHCWIAMHGPGLRAIARSRIGNTRTRFGTTKATDCRSGVGTFRCIRS